jgi:hypothetical protein
MRMAPKRRPVKKDNAPTTLDEKARALAEAQAKLEAEIAAQQRLIQEAPERAKEMRLRQRDELIRSKSRTETRPGSRTALPDRRFSELNAAVAPVRQRGLRAERRRGRLMFFVLLVTFCGLVYWLYYTVTHP